MPLPKLVCRPDAGAAHALFLLPAAKTLPADLPERARWQAVLKRRGLKAAELAKSPLTLDLADGGRAACAMVDPRQARFERLTLLRKAVMALLDESPAEIALVPLGVDADAVRDAVHVALLNAAPLPARKKKPARAVKTVMVAARRAAGADNVSAQADDSHGRSQNCRTPAGRHFGAATALAAANTLARELIALPPNELPPAAYRRRVRALAARQGWRIEEYGFRRLVKMGAGAFCAIAQGSGDDEAAIVHLSHRPKGAKRRVALVGKGICFDTGGHNLKPGTYMTGMHTDMGGSAVALALMQAVAALGLPLAVDCWLAIAANHLSPLACVPGDIVTALDGTTIEIVHTDAEGRMVLADALTLAARGAPDLIVDFATLTGGMKTALGRRYSGVFASDDALAALAVAAGRASGERVCAFPLDADYEAALESRVADIKQCALEGAADPILAARFLWRFTRDLPWLHMDLSATLCAGGLGAVASEQTGFGVAWGAEFLERWLGQG